MPFNMVMVKFVKAITRLLAYSLTNIFLLKHAKIGCPGNQL